MHYVAYKNKNAFICSILNHQLNIDKNGTVISNVALVSSRKCSIQYCFGC